MIQNAVLTACETHGYCGKGGFGMRSVEMMMIGYECMMIMYTSF